MNAYKLLWVLFRAVCRGHGKAPIFFDTEARTFDYHMAKVGIAYCERNWIDDGFQINLHEERQ